MAMKRPLIVTAVTTEGSVEHKEIDQLEIARAVLLFEDAARAENFLAGQLLRPTSNGAYELWRSFTRS